MREWNAQERERTLKEIKKIGILIEGAIEGF